MPRYPEQVLKADVALIGGTGIGSRLAQMEGQRIAVATPFGLMRGRLIDHDGVRLVTVERHSAGHKTPPHLVNYRAIASGLQRLGVKGCLSSAASGSLHAKWPIGTFVCCTDFIEFTFRSLTMHERTVEHVDFSSPFSAGSALIKAADNLELEIQPHGVYVATNGPRYETPGEINMLRTMGADLVGMTAATEAVVMAEAGVRYGCLGVITNLAAGLSAELSHGEVIDVMKERGGDAVRIMLEAARLLAS